MYYLCTDNLIRTITWLPDNRALKVVYDVFN